MVMRESTVVGSPQRDAAEKRKIPGERETSSRKGRVLERGEMRMRETDMQIDERRAHGTGEVIRKGIEEMIGIERREGKGTG